jgi:ectoine hydroxylase-related dioxygenase (phytanoyl-CoA dioxygenase family)
MLHTADRGSKQTTSDALRENYASEGYIIASQAFDTAAVRNLCQSFETVLNKLGTSDTADAESLSDNLFKREKEDHSIVYQGSQAMGSSAATFELLGASGIFETISKLTGFEKTGLHLMPLYLIVQMPSDERFDYTWHQDGSYYPWCRDFLTLWFPINRKTGSNAGTISIIPESHKYGMRETETTLRHGFFKQMQSKLREGEAQREKPLEMELGDCCIMNGNTVHRSVANRANTPRVAAVVRIAYLPTLESYDRDKFYCSHKS